MAVRFRWVGWFDGESDCEPPEPGKFWIEIQEDVRSKRTSYVDPIYEEFCVIVHRTENFEQTDDSVLDKERRADAIVDMLNILDNAARRLVEYTNGC